MQSADLSSNAIAAAIRKKVNAEVPEAVVKIIGPPAVAGLGSAGGFKFIIEDRSGGTDLEGLQREADQLILDSRKDPKIADLFTVFRANTPQLYVDLNRQQCQTMGVN